MEAICSPLCAEITSAAVDNDENTSETQNPIATPSSASPAICANSVERAAGTERSLAAGSRSSVSGMASTNRANPGTAREDTPGSTISNPARRAKISTPVATVGITD